VLIVVMGALTTMAMDSISGAWKFLMAIGAGTGLVFILRWYWWRINAWSEISAMIASFVISAFLQVGLGMSAQDPQQFSLLMLITVIGSTLIWLTVTFLTAPEEEALLVAFYKKVKPAGRLWQRIYEPNRLEISKDSLGLSLRAWIVGVVFVYCFLFALGSLFFGEFWVGIILMVISLCAVFLLWLDLKRF
jgi:SSS family solute:Na+ symporter